MLSSGVRYEPLFCCGKSLAALAACFKWCIVLHVALRWRPAPRMFQHRGGHLFVGPILPRGVVMPSADAFSVSKSLHCAVVITPLLLQNPCAM